MPFVFAPLAAPLAAAASPDPVLLPLSVDPVVADRPARLAAIGAAATDGALDAAATAELALASRAAFGASVGIGARDGEAGDLLAGFAARVELLDADTAPLGLGASARYVASGFSVDRGEVELSVQAARHLGPTYLLAGITGGREVTRPDGDVEATVAAVHPVVGALSVGLDARARAAVRGDAEAERERELGNEENEEAAWDARAGALASVGSDGFGGFGFAGMGVVGQRDAGPRWSAALSVGVQLVR